MLECRNECPLLPRSQQLLLVPKTLGETRLLLKQSMLNRAHAPHMGSQTAEISAAALRYGKDLFSVLKVVESGPLASFGRGRQPAAKQEFDDEPK